MAASAPARELHPTHRALRSALAGLSRTYASIELIDRGRLAGALVDAAGRVVAATAAAPIGNLEALAATVRATFPGLARGDAVLTNDPYSGGTCVREQFVLAPVTGGGTAAVCAPCFDIGGKRLNNVVPEALDLFAEGCRITPVLLARAVEPDTDVLRLLRSNSRVPVLAEADALALLHTCLALAERATELEPPLSRSAEMVAAALAGRSAEATAGSVRLRLTATTVDLTGSSPAKPSHENTTLPTTRSALAYALRDQLGCPLDSGVLEPIRLIAPAGSVVDCPPYAAVGGSVPDDVRAALLECLR